MPRACAESFNISSAPCGANVEIDGAIVGTTPFHVDYPGGYFHKTQTVCGARLEHAMTLRISKDGCATRQITRHRRALRVDCGKRKTPRKLFCAEVRSLR
jgi:hypothetical protein